MKIKTKEYKNFDEFEMDESRSEYELVTIVNKTNGVCADLMTECKRWRTAVDRFFKTLEGDSRFDGWKESIVESIENGCWKDRETVWNEEKCKSEYTGGYFWEVEGYDSCYYVCINVPV